MYKINFSITTLHFSEKKKKWTTGRCSIRVECCDFSERENFPTFYPPGGRGAGEIPPPPILEVKFLLCLRYNRPPPPSVCGIDNSRSHHHHHHPYQQNPTRKCSRAVGTNYAKLWQNLSQCRNMFEFEEKNTLGYSKWKKV